MEKQLIVITEAEFRALKYGQDIVTEMSRNIDDIDRTVQGIDGFIVGLIDNIAEGNPVTEEQLNRLFHNYVGQIRTFNNERREKARLLWRSMQDEENKVREDDEIQRGVNS